MSAISKSKSKLRNDGILFCGKNAEDVTGSQTLIKYNNKNILLECGLHQSNTNSYLDSYKVNSEKFSFKPSELDYVFICHPHIDHVGLLPRLIKEGFKGKIILNKITSVVSEALIKNCCFILDDEARVLSKRYNRTYEPIYDIDDVERTIDFFSIYDEYNKIYKLDDSVSFQWIKNSHCVGACQLQLILNDGVNTKKILYTSDIGGFNTRNHYVDETVIPDMHNHITIMESTYGENKRTSKKTRDFDIEHLRVAINTVLERKGTVILPAFSFSRSQELLTTLYNIYGEDSNFNTKIIVDSILSCEMCDIYSSIFDGKNKKEWEKVYNWENVKYIKDKEESKMCVLDETPKIVISSSGFCTNGRVVSYLEKYLRDVNSMIIFSGYVGDNESYLSYRIKNGKSNKTININKKPIPNKADAITMSTFSSHANFNDLVKYGSSLKTDKLVLVHGSQEAKLNLKNSLKEEISKNDNTYKVICSEKGMIIPL